jgi:excisionase family DNA binding protein
MTLYTVSEISEKLKCSLANTYSLIERGELGHIPVGANGGGLRVSEDQLQAFFEKRQRHPGENANPLEPRCSPIKLRHLK